MQRWLKKLWDWVVSATVRVSSHFRAKPAQSYTTRVFGDRALAQQAVKKGDVLAIVESGGKQKWALLRCPCGCNEELALNLMRSHRPVWQVAVNDAGLASLHPSVHSTKCGAHFWVKDGRVIWCE